MACFQIYPICQEAVKSILRNVVAKVTIILDLHRYGSDAALGLLKSPILPTFIEGKVNSSLWSVIIGLMSEKIHTRSDSGHKYEGLAKKKCATFIKRNACWQTLVS